MTRTRWGHGGFHTQKLTYPARGNGGSSARERERERGGREGGVKSGSPCTACASKTRSSFLHLQVERRDIRHGLHHPTFSICDNVSSPSPLPSPRCCLRFFFPRPACHASWKSFQKPSGKLMATNDDGSRLSSLFRSLDGDFFFFFLKWNVSIGSHDSPRYVIYS